MRTLICANQAPVKSLKMSNFAMLNFMLERDTMAGVSTDFWTTFSVACCDFSAHALPRGCCAVAC